MLKGKVQQQQKSLCCSYDTYFKFVVIEQPFCDPEILCWGMECMLLEETKKSVFKGRKLNLKNTLWALIGKF